MSMVVVVVVKLCMVFPALRSEHSSWLRENVNGPSRMISIAPRRFQNRQQRRTQLIHKLLLSGMKRRSTNKERETLKLTLLSKKPI